MKKFTHLNLKLSRNMHSFFFVKLELSIISAFLKFLGFILSNESIKFYKLSCTAYLKKISTVAATSFAALALPHYAK